MILVISHPHDPHAMQVLEILREEGRPTHLLDLSKLPHHGALVAAYSQEGLDCLEYLAYGQGSIRLDKVKSVWWRRPQLPDLSIIADFDVQAFTYNEWQEAINGLWQVVRARWMNPPLLDEAAGRKMLQLKIATDVGLRIPKTLITSDPDRARAFIANQGATGTIYKTFSCTHAIWRETRLVREEELELLDSVQLAPVIFQENIAPAADLRVTVVGNEVYTALIDSEQTDYPYDFRMSLGQARAEATALPTEVEEKLRALLDRLGLAYGAIDLRRTHEGDYIFLEVNTAGEFLFVEERTGLPISRAIANWLVKSS